MRSAPKGDELAAPIAAVINTSQAMPNGGTIIIQATNESLALEDDDIDNS